MEGAVEGHLVGLMIKALISFCLNLVPLLMIRSRVGITNAKVFPEPVTASTTTSLFCMNRGMVEA